MKEKFFKIIEKEAMKYLRNPKQSVAHREGHIKRVMRYAMQIAKNYKNVDLELLKIAVILHDVCKPYDKKEKHVDLSVKVARKILEKVSYPKKKARKVLEIISQHSTEKLQKPKSLEAKILFDADKLDGVGASGIARVFALFGQQRKEPEEAIEWYKRKMKIALKNLQTKEGKKLAKEKLKFVQDFLKRFKEENRKLYKS